MAKGFSLIELILVTAMILSLAVFSFSFYARFLTQNGVANAVDQIVQQVRKAQAYAMESRKSNVSGWGVAWNSPNIVLYQGSSYADRNTALDERFSVSNAITITGLTDVNFARVTGLPSTTATISISGMGTEKTLGINGMGVISR